MDYRSDTFTLPTDEMKKAMIKAPLGDDVYCEDPTVNELEDFVADLAGKEASIFVPTCTMANLIAVGAHSQYRFSEIILGNLQHIHSYEVGGISSLMGVHSTLLKNLPDGTLDIDEVKETIRQEDVHHPVTSAVCVENTHNICGGRILHPEYLQALSKITKAKNIPIHMDGARVLNAVSALNMPLKSIVQSVDSVSICFSKGLCAPAGAVLTGSKSLISRARHLRKALGGGMRQVGVLAACGTFALKNMTARLEEDNNHAKILATKLEGLDGISISGGIESVQTNIFFAEMKKNVPAIIDSLAKEGVLVGQYGTNKIRMVTHRDVPISKIDKVVTAFAKCLK